MSQRPRPHRHVIERRVLPDRRRGLDRRIADRRWEALVVRRDRRARPRRTLGERRNPRPRRSRLDRGGSGITWSAGPPLL